MLSQKDYNSLGGRLNATTENYSNCSRFGLFFCQGLFFKNQMSLLCRSIVEDVKFVENYESQT